jgi:hypothetical protein
MVLVGISGCTLASCCWRACSALIVSPWYGLKLTVRAMSYPHSFPELSRAIAIASSLRCCIACCGSMLAMLGSVE